jgi:integrase
MDTDYWVGKIAGRGDIFYVRFRRGGKRVFVSTGKTNEKAAHKEALRIIGQPTGSDTLVGDFLKPFYSDTCPHITRLRDEGKNYAEKNRKANRSLLERVILPDPICSIALGELTRGDVLGLRRRLVESLGACRTVNVAMRLFSVAIHEALFLEYMTRDPCAKIGQVAYPKKARKALPLVDVRGLLLFSRWSCWEHWAATVTAAMTGARAGEVRALTWGDLNVKAKTISITKALDQTTSEILPPKWGKFRTAPYPLALQAVLELRRDDDAEAFVFSGMGYTRWAKEFRQVAIAADVPGVTLHSLRHSLNTHLRGNGVSDEGIRAALGWSNDSTQEGYTHRELYDYSDQVKVIDRLLGPPRASRKLREPSRSRE